MRKLITYIGTGLAAVAMIIAVATTAQAWHPVGVIKKEVQNVTQNSALSDANSSHDAVAVNPGDTVKYVITVSNNGQYHRQGHNDMHYTKVTDTLPSGISLVGGQPNMTLGHIKANESKRYEFTAKVTSSNNGEIICNTAKFTGDSEVYDQPQNGSDKACVKIVVPAPKMIEVCYKNQGPHMHKIKETEFNSETMSKNPADCKKPEKMIEVCYKNQSPQMHKIKESDFNSETMSKDPKDCKKPVKEIEICYLDQGPHMHKIKETEFNSETMSKNPADCKKPEKMIEVCYISKGNEIHKIKESEFDKETMSTNPADCKKPEDKNIEICVFADKEIKIIKESEFDKETMTHDKKECDTPAPKPVPVPTPKPTEPVVAELPKTGVADLLGGLVGIGSVTAASVAYFRSRR